MMSFVRALAVLLLMVLLASCGGGGGGSTAVGGNPQPGGSAPPPPPPAQVDYQGVAAAAFIDEENAGRFAATVIDGIGLVEDIAEALVREVAPRPGAIDETVAGPGGGSARLRGNIASGGTGWIEVVYDGFREEGVRLDGREVQVILAPATAQSINVRLSYYGLRIESDEAGFEITGSLTRRETGGLTGSIDNDVDFLVTDLGSGQQRRAGPWQYSLDADLRQLRIPSLAIRAYSPEDGYGDVELIDPLVFGRAPPDRTIDDGPALGTLRFLGAADSRFDLVALNVYFGALEFPGPGDRVATRRIAWADDYDDDRPGPGDPQAIAGATVYGEPFEPAELDGRLASHSGQTSLLHQWMLVARPPGSLAQIEDALAPVATLVPDRHGTYLIEQRVTDGLQEASDFTRVLVVDRESALNPSPSLPPSVAYPGPDRRVTLGEVFSVDGRVAALRRVLSPGDVEIFGGEDFVELDADQPVVRLVAQAPGAFGVTSQVRYPPGQAQLGRGRVFVDTPVWTHEPLLFADERGVLYRPTDAALVDFRGDGRAELVISRLEPTSDGEGEPPIMEAMLTIIPVPGGGELGEPQHLSLPFAGALAIGDINGSGRADVVIRARETLGVFYQQPDGTLQTGPQLQLPRCPARPAGVPGSVHVGDVTGDGRPDIVTIGGCYQQQVEPDLLVWAQQADGSLVSVYTPVPGFSPSVLEVGDLNGDGRVDVTYNGGAIGGGRLVLGWGQADGRFIFEEVELGGDAGTPVVHDFDGDGLEDVAIVAGNSLRLWYQRVDGSFEQATFPGAGQGTFTGLFAGDLDGDGRADLVALSPGSSLVSSEAPTRVILQQPGNSFSAARSLWLLSTAPEQFSRLLIADLTGDGRGEVLAVRLAPGSVEYAATLEMTLLR